MTPEEASATVVRLFLRLVRQQARIVRADLYYGGQQPLSYLAPEVQAQVGRRLTSLVVNWPRVIVDSVQRRCYVEGFRLGGGGEADESLRVIWQKNDLDEWSHLAHTDSLVHGRAFLSIAPNDQDRTAPRIMVETARQVVVEYSPGSRRVRAALKTWQDGTTAYATLYEPAGRWRFRATSAPLINDPSSSQSLIDTYSLPAGGAWEPLPGEEFTPSNLGVVPIVPLANRPRVLNLDGESELTDVMPLADAVNKLATDMMVSAEYHAMPRRWATGIEVPAGPQRERLQAEVTAYWDQATKGKTWLAGSNVAFGQFAEASLDNFVGGIKLLTSQIAAIGGLPPDDLGLATTNPASAEARRAADVTLVSRAGEKQRVWGGGWERSLEIAICLRDGIPYVDLPDEYRLMETIWRDPNTPAIAQSMDAAVKGVAAGIYDAVQGQEEVGLTPTQQSAIRARSEEAAATAATADVRAQLALAQQLQDTQGLSVNASLAAVGLLQAAALNAAP